MNLGILARPDFMLFTAARVLGIGIRPLILFLAAAQGFVDFSDAFALFTTSVAGSFVVFTNEAHIRLYRAEFNGTRDILRLFLATRYFVVNVISHAIWFAALGVVLLYIWTGDLWLSAFGLLILLGEKVFDEFQRYYTYQRAYIMWTIGFGFRYGLPGLAVLVPVLIGVKPTLTVYVTAYVLSCLIYLFVWERRRMAFYGRLYARYWRGIRSLLTYVQTYARDLYANQAWSFLAANFYLLDRVMINQSAVSIGAYVFFCNLFNLAVFAHTTLYYVRRRPDLIDDRATLRREFFRLPNLVPPALYTLCIAGFGWFLTQSQPAYADFDLMLIGGLAVYYFAQAIALVAIDFMFWRIPRGKLVLTDLALGTICLGAYFAFPLPTSFIPALMTVLIGSRILAYALLWRRTGKFLARP